MRINTSFLIIIYYAKSTFINPTVTNLHLYNYRKNTWHQGLYGENKIQDDKAKDWFRVQASEQDKAKPQRPPKQLESAEAIYQFE